jgi:hypothetical protein
MLAMIAFREVTINAGGIYPPQPEADLAASCVSADRKVVRPSLRCLHVGNAPEDKPQVSPKKRVMKDYLRPVGRIEESTASSAFTKRKR